MAALGEIGVDVLDLALRAGRPRAAMAEAERFLLARRMGPPDMPAAVALAVRHAVGDAATKPAILRSAAAIAEAVERHGAAFRPGDEPAYHDRHHQAEAAVAMGWLMGAAKCLGMLTPDQRALAVAAMAAHDLLHDGRASHERGTLERQSADAAAAIGSAQGLAQDDIITLRRIVLATTWPWEDAEAPDLSCRMAREADLFASSLPVLGPRLSRLLARELIMAGQPATEGVASHAARVALLRLLPPPTAPAEALGLGQVRDTQLQAYEGAARRLGLPGGKAEDAAAALDAMDSGDADAVLAWGGAVP